jgi:hypothetical protein
MLPCPGDQGKDGVEVRHSGWGLDARANVELVDGEPGYCGLVDRPKRCFALAGRGETVGGEGEAFGHAKRKAEIDGQGKPHMGSEECAGKRIEDGGVDQAGERRQIVAGDCEVGGGGENGVGEVAECGRTERAGLRAQHEDGTRPVLFGKLVSVDEVRGGVGPRGVSRRSGHDPQRRIGVCRECVRGSDEQASRRERSGQFGEDTFELFRLHGGEQDEESGARACGRGGDVRNWICCRHGYPGDSC